MLRLIMIALLGVTLVVASLTCDQPAAAVPLEFAGPSTYHNEDGANSGAIQDVLIFMDGSALVGSTNGGVWKTDDLSAASPHWRSVTDHQPVNCTSISALRQSAFDATVIYAGCGGSTSSEQGADWNVLNNGDWGGLMVSNDSGETWSMTDFPANYYITGIEVTAPDTLIVSARSHYYDANDGGIWASRGGLWTRVFNRPVFNLKQPAAGVLLAGLPFSPDTVYMSADAGIHWSSWSTGLSWAQGAQPYYPTFTSLGDLVFLGALTTFPGSPRQPASSQVFSRSLQDAQWKRLAEAPILAADNMPKDRMALLALPARDTSYTLYAAGNGVKAFSRRYSASGAPLGNWTSLTEASAPHADNRNLAFNGASGELVVVCDGGAFAYNGTRWRSLNGDIRVLECVSAAWDASWSRFACGAQDNGVLLSPRNSSPSDAAVHVVGGDGTLVSVDNSRSPARFFSSSQFLGAGQPAAFEAATGDDAAVYFKLAGEFRYFVGPGTVNSVDPAQYVYWAAGAVGGSTPSGISSVAVPANLKDAFGAPQLVHACGPVFSLVAGGVTRSLVDPRVIAALNSTHFYYRSAVQPFVVRPLPSRFAEPVGDRPGDLMPGPLTHGKTVSVAVSPLDSSLVAVSGWPSVIYNNGTEHVYVSEDAGASWRDVMGDLARVTGTIGKVRPSGLTFVPLADGSVALLLGTTRGVYATFDYATWTRLGDCDTFPLVMVMGIQYEATSDTLVVASFGRGVYILKHASKALLKAKASN